MLGHKKKSPAELLTPRAWNKRWNRPFMSSLTYYPHSFDTLKIVIPVRDISGLDAKFPIKRESYKNNPDGSRKSTQLLHFLTSSADYPDAPSWWTPPQITLRGWEIWVQFSLPKLFFGHSARHAGVDHLTAALQGWETWFRARGVDVVEWPDWQLREIHFCYNFQLESAELVAQAERQLSRLRYRGKLPFQDKHNAYPYWSGLYRTIKFYQKGQEMWTHRKRDGSHYPEDWLKARLSALDTILRFEEEWRNKQLITFCGIQAYKDVGKNKRLRSNYIGSDVRGKGNSKDFQKAELIKQVTISKFLSKLDKFSVVEHLDFIKSNFTSRSPADNLEEVRNKIKLLRRSVETNDFLDAVLSRGLSMVKAEMSKSTFYACKKRFDKLGYPIEFFDTQFDDVIIAKNSHAAKDEYFARRSRPVDISKFVNPRNFVSIFDQEDILEDPVYLEVREYAYNFVGDNYKLG